MKKAKYVIMNSDNEYFVKINKLNKAVFTNDKNKALEVEFSETENLIPIIELYNKTTVVAEQA